MMTLNEYQKMAARTSQDTIIVDEDGLLYPLLGAVGELGEIANKVKKIYRDKNGKITDDDKLDLILEIGDVEWYLSEFTRKLGVELDTVAELNIDKLTSRAKRGMIGGSGDNR